MAKFNFEYADAPGQIVLRAEADPAHFSGGRNAFGPFLRLQLQWPYDSDLPRHRALAVQGSLLWAHDPDLSGGLAVPLQVVTPNGPVTIPVSDEQLARLENRRAGGEPNFALRLEVIVQREAPSGDGRTPELAVRTVSNSWPVQQLPVSRDAWARIVANCGLGLRRIVELPPPPGHLGGDWDRASAALEEASKLLAQGYDEQAIVAVRKALERMVDGVAAALGKEPRNGAFGPYVDVLVKQIKALEPVRSHPFHLIAELLRSTFNFASGHAHGTSTSSRREQAVLTLSLGTSLYGFLADGTLGALAIDQNVDVHEGNTGESE